LWPLLGDFANAMSFARCIAKTPPSNKICLTSMSSGPHQVRQSRTYFQHLLVSIVYCIVVGVAAVIRVLIEICGIQQA
jgi:hypothetical protein